MRVNCHELSWNGDRVTTVGWYVETLHEPSHTSGLARSVKMESGRVSCDSSPSCSGKQSEWLSELLLPSSPYTSLFPCHLLPLLPSLFSSPFTALTTSVTITISSNVMSSSSLPFQPHPLPPPPLALAWFTHKVDTRWFFDLLHNAAVCVQLVRCPTDVANGELAGGRH